MALKLYTLMIDVSNQFDFIDRYIAENSPPDSLKEGAVNPYVGATNMAWATRDRRIAADNQAMTLEYREADRQWSQMLDRYARNDFTSAKRWAVTFYGEALAAGALPDRVRAFLDGRPTKVNAFSHFADREQAMFWARQAASKNFQQIAAMSGHQQLRAVDDMWNCVGRYFRCINVRPWAWAKFRNRIKVNIGTYSGPNDPDVGTSSSVYQQRLHLSNWGCPGFRTLDMGTSASRYNSLPQDKGFLFQYDPSPVADKYPGVWRITAARLMSAKYGRNFGTPGLRFGLEHPATAGSNLYEGGVRGAALQRSCISVGSEMTSSFNALQGVGVDQYNICTHPTGEGHTIWMKSNALTRDFMSELMQIRRVDPGTIFAEQSGTNYQNIMRRPWGVDDYSESFSRLTGDDLIPFPPTGSSQWNWLDDNMHLGDWATYVPPHLWYAKLLWPLVEYLMTKDPIEIVAEVKMDVIGRNLWQVTANAGGGRGTDISFAEDNLAETIVNSVFGLGAGIVGAINPIAGAIVGAVGFGVSTLMSALSDRDAVLIDCFGRRFSGNGNGIIEPFLIVDKSRREQLPAVARELGGGDVGIFWNRLADDGSYATQPANVRRGFVKRTGEETPVFADAEPLPIVFRRPEAPSRLAKKQDRSSAMRQKAWLGRFPPLLLSPLLLPPPPAFNSQIRIVGLPDGSSVDVDGQPSQGAWDASRSSWTVPSRSGPVTIRVTQADGRVFVYELLVPADGPATIPYGVINGTIDQGQNLTDNQTASRWPVIAIGAAAILAAGYIVTRGRNDRS